MSSRLTMSRLELASNCAASMSLPWVDTDSTAARKGSTLHAYLHDVRTLGAEAALARVPADLRGVAEGWDLDGLPTDPAAYAGEVAFALDLVTGQARELGRNLERRYPPVGPSEIVGSADVVSLTPDRAIVLDLKTGRGAVTRARDNLQLRALALAACRAYGRDEAEVVLLHRREDNSGWTERATLDCFELDATLEELRRVRDRVMDARQAVEAGRTPDLREGGHCRYCGAFRACPAKTALIRELAAGPVSLAEEIKAQLTPERAAEAYRRLVIIEAVVRFLRAAVYSWAEENPIDLGGGRTFGPHVVRGKRLVNGRVAYAVLSRLHGPEVAAAACEMETSQAAITDALRVVATATKEKITHLKAAAMEAIEAEGGVSRAPDKTRIEEYEMREAEPAPALDAAGVNA